LWDGNEKQEVTSPSAIDTTRFGIYHVYSVDKKGLESDLSNPVMISPVVYTYKPENNRFRIDVPAGKYWMRIVGANGNGPDGTYCAIRSVEIDGQDVGTFIVEANGHWERFTNSNCIFINVLKEGKHLIELKLNPENKGYDSNMSRNKENKNELKIAYLELIAQ
jgi:hypothetical protein